MTRAELAAKVGCAVVGVFALDHVVRAFFSLALAVYLTMGAGAAPYPAIKFALQCGLLLLLGVIIFRLLFRSEGLFARMTAPAGERGEVVSCLWAVGAFRAAMVFCGAVIVMGQIESVVLWSLLIIHVPKLVVELMNYGTPPDMYQESYHFWCSHLSGLISIALAGYLLAGAPHFVKWQTGGHWYAESQGDDVVERT